MTNLQDHREDITSNGLGSACEWADMSDRDHFVQFYTDEQQIIQAVSGYFINGIRFNEACVMVATRSHIREIKRLIRSVEPRIDVAISEQTFIILDAHETLSKIMVGGMPDKDLFDDAVGSVIQKAAGNQKRVRAFGEMVGLLTDAGNAAAAVELESLWNTLAKSQQLRLFCAYPYETLSRPDAASHVNTICSAHTRVLGQAIAA